LNVIRKKRGLSRAKDLPRRMLNWMNPGGANALRLSRLHMFGLGTNMMKGLMRKEKMPSLEQLISMAGSLGVQFVACTTSMAMMSLTEDDFISEVQDYAGAASYLGIAREAQVNLFI
jgi:peroxiredoxin family protein